MNLTSEELLLVSDIARSAFIMKIKVTQEIIDGYKEINKEEHRGSLEFHEQSLKELESVLEKLNQIAREEQK